MISNLLLIVMLTTGTVMTIIVTAIILGAFQCAKTQDKMDKLANKLFIASVSLFILHLCSIALT